MNVMRKIAGPVLLCTLVPAILVGCDKGNDAAGGSDDSSDEENVVTFEVTGEFDTSLGVPSPYISHSKSKKNERNKCRVNAVVDGFEMTLIYPVGLKEGDEVKIVGDYESKYRDRMDVVQADLTYDPSNMVEPKGFEGSYNQDASGTFTVTEVGDKTLSAEWEFDATNKKDDKSAKVHVSGEYDELPRCEVDAG
ncbi:hypothetical protein FIV42_25360 [Persicimonas caeni]|uniref:Uncharacterized protein n=1 Tax=Persicimonas caeni TaxID=2292766 RepID=A0A4Y6Q0I0_PERCE|nr:hypothetical protein [Persicimonas caeni]QDG53949.1 hypothetical protein FIV42_25360 [Persicimonas caeni]QED35170.1 hypothetical protein FRD00_25355 [Persicimonas caeni]